MSEEGISKEELNQLATTIKFRLQAAYSMGNSEISRNMISHFYDSLAAINKNLSCFSAWICQKCFSLFNEANQNSTFYPKKRLNKRQRKALNDMTKYIKNGAKKKDQRLLNSTSKLKINCLACGYTNTINGPSYVDLIPKKRALKKKKRALMGVEELKNSKVETKDFKATTERHSDQRKAKVLNKKFNLKNFSPRDKAASVAQKKPPRNLNAFMRSKNDNQVLSSNLHDFLASL